MKLCVPHWRIGLTILVLLLASGCGEKNGGRQKVSGTIKLKGVLLDEGVIEFFPKDGGGGTKTGAVITNGAYSIEEESGLLPGEYSVRITSGDGVNLATPTDEPPGPTGSNIVSKDRIPAEYNTETTQEVEVSNSRPNVFDYDIP